MRVSAGSPARVCTHLGAVFYLLIPLTRSISEKAKIVSGLPVFRSILSVHMTKNKRLNITPEWYKSSTNRPKLFNATLERLPDGNYRVIEAVVEAVVNQHESRIQAVDARDFARSLRGSRVFAL